MNADVFHNTPTIRVSDNRGLFVRDIAYHRHPDTLLAAKARITRHSYDARGLLNRSVDPRLHETGLSNFTHATDLQGSDLRRQSVDAGTTLALNDTAGRPLFNVINIRTDALMQDDRAAAVTRTFEYEPSAQAGRLIAIKEQINATPARITERQLYGTHSEAHKQRNLAGQPVCHYDTAGLQTTDSLALTGAVLSMSRRLLKDGDNPETLADWQGQDSAVWDTLLAPDTYTTLIEADATGVVLASSDAAGHRQRLRYNLAGQHLASWLTLKGGAEQAIVSSLGYSAAGQKLREVHGNGVVTTYTYAPRTQRLVAIRSDRLAAPAKVLQDLRYAYDPVGNVLHVSNDAEATRFWRNQEVVPENTYVYDTLYQLVSATGREMANGARHGSRLPRTTIPLPPDTAAYTTYTRAYSYDIGGNLTQIRHSSPVAGNSYSIDMMVSDRSNRAVLSTLAGSPPEVEALFDAGGHQCQLQPGQTLAWTSRGELQRVTPVVRPGQADDSECYRYRANGQRLLKVSRQQSLGVMQTQRALYLPGLELRTTAQDDTPTENLQVVTVGDAGSAQVRVLHWVRGLPGGITNDQVRYSYNDLVGSSGLEVDATGNVISKEEYYPYGGTALWAARSQVEASYKTIRYSGKERDATGLYYYGHRYYQPWAGRWLSADPAGTVDGLNLYRMVRNNPMTLFDVDGLAPDDGQEPMTVAQRRKLFSAPVSTPPAPQAPSRPAAAVQKGQAGTEPLRAPIDRGPSISAGVSAETVQPLASRPASSGTVKASNVSARTRFTLFRADNRSYDVLSKTSPEGFKAWVPLDAKMARQLASVFVGKKDTSGLPRHVVDNINKWGEKPRLGDLSTYIKYTKDKTTVWVSTAINTEAGGQSAGAPLYEISIELYEFRIGKQGLEPLPEGRTKNMEFSLLLDGLSIDESSVIALNHGPKDDAEVSFLTAIPMKNIRPYAA